MKTDKKNYSKNINLVLLKEIGKPTSKYSFNENQLKKFFNSILIN